MPERPADVPRPTPEGAPTTWWLIEFPRGSRGSEGVRGYEDGWWCGRESGSDLFSWDPEKAIRFRTKADAETVRAASLISYYTVITEHVWIAASPSWVAPEGREPPQGSPDGTTWEQAEAHFRSYVSGAGEIAHRAIVQVLERAALAGAATP